MVLDTGAPVQGTGVGRTLLENTGRAGGRDKDLSGTTCPGGETASRGATEVDLVYGLSIIEKSEMVEKLFFGRLYKATASGTSTGK